MTIPQPDGAAASSNHCYRVKAALEASGLPFELRAVISKLAEKANWQTGVCSNQFKISQADLAAGLGCDVRTLRRYQKVIKGLPGKPWVTWKRNAGPNGIGRGIDDFAVHVGDPINAEQAKRITLSGRTQEDRTTDPSGQILRPKRITLSDPLDHGSFDQSERAEADAPSSVSSKSEKQIAKAKPTPPPPDLITSPTYLALGDKRGMDRRVTIAELQKLAQHDGAKGKRYADWTFRADQWLENAVQYRSRPAKAGQLALVRPVQTPEERERLIKANAETAQRLEAKRIRDREEREAKMDPQQLAEENALIEKLAAGSASVADIASKLFG